MFWGIMRRQLDEANTCVVTQSQDAINEIIGGSFTVVEPSKMTD